MGTYIYFVKNFLESLGKFVYSIGEVMSMNFGERILAILEAKNMTRADLCRVTGLKSSYLVGYIKNPDRSPTLSTACKIAIALDVSLDYLGGLIDEPRPIDWEQVREAAEQLSPEVREIVDAYESSNAQGKASIMAVAQAQKRVERTDEALQRRA